MTMQEARERTAVGAYYQRRSAESAFMVKKGESAIQDALFISDAGKIRRAEDDGIHPAHALATDWEPLSKTNPMFTGGPGDWNIGKEISDPGKMLRLEWTYAVTQAHEDRITFSAEVRR